MLSPERDPKLCHVNSGAPSLRGIAKGESTEWNTVLGGALRQSNSDTVLAMRPVPRPNLKRRIVKDALRENRTRDAAFRRMIRSLPPGQSFNLWRNRARRRIPRCRQASSWRASPRFSCCRAVSRTFSLPASCFVSLASLQLSACGSFHPPHASRVCYSSSKTCGFRRSWPKLC